MDEKTMVNDTLECVKSNLITYQKIINETENIELRQMLQQTRNTDESFQYELFKVAQVKGYYSQSIQANSKDIQKIKTEFE